jgi:hypothetical protein
MRRTAAAILAASIISAAAFAGSASAQTTNVYSFHDCTGGSLDSFWAWKTLLPAAEGGTASSAGAFHLTDGSAIFVVLSFGGGFPPGINRSGNATTTCLVDFSVGTREVVGFFAPPGP